MKADRGFDGGDDGGGPEDLRKILRQWKAPAPSPEIEEELRRTFRRGRSSRRWRGWLILAASLLVVAALALLLNDSRRAPGRLAERPTPPLVSSSPAPPPPVAPERAAIQGRVHASPVPAGRVPVAPPARNEVIVEPGQAELLAELAHQWRDARQAGPGLTLPRIEVLAADAPPSAILQARAHDEVPEYRTRWEDVESEWPLAHWSL